MVAGREEAVAEARLALREFLAAQRRLRGREAQRHGSLSFSQYAVLRVLVDGEEHPIGELATAAPPGRDGDTQLEKSATIVGRSSPYISTRSSGPNDAGMAVPQDPAPSRTVQVPTHCCWPSRVTTRTW